MEAIHSVRNTILGLEEGIDLRGVRQVCLDGHSCRVYRSLRFDDVDEDKPNIWRLRICVQSSSQLCAKSVIVSNSSMRSCDRSHSRENLGTPRLQLSGWYCYLPYGGKVRYANEWRTSYNVERAIESTASAAPISLDCVSEYLVRK